MRERYPELSIVLPAYNEEANLDAALDAATEVAERLCVDHEIVVVDDGSTDGTADLLAKRIAADDRIRTVRHEPNRGYGEALRTGFRAATKPMVFFTDADNQFDMNELELFLPWITHVDVVAGYRVKRQDTVMRRLNARAWNVLVRMLFYVPVRDIDCAFKLFRRSVFDDLELEAVGAMVNTELMVKLARSGKSVVEIGVTHRPRRAGRARGASPRVIATAFQELFAMYRRLKSADSRSVPVPPGALNGSTAKDQTPAAQ